METNNSDWVIGAAINVCGSIMINFGTNLLKYSHIQAAESFKHNFRMSKQSSHGTHISNQSISRISGSGTFLWKCGFLTFATGNVLNFVSFSFGNQSLLSALGSVQFLTNVIFAWKVLGENITNRIVGGSALIFCGNVVIVYFASRSSTNYTVDELMENYIALPYRIYLITAGAVVAMLAVFYSILEKQLNSYRVLSGRVSNASPQSTAIPRLLPLCYALISGIIGTQSVILAKSCSVLLRITIEGDNQLNNYFTYVIVALWCLTMFIWFKRMNSALQKFEGVFIIPVLQVVWILFSIVSGGVYFREFSQFSTLQSIMFIAGVVLILIGVALLAPRRHQDFLPLKTFGSGSIDASIHEKHTSSIDVSLSAVPCVYIAEEQMAAALYRRPSVEQRDIS